MRNEASVLPRLSRAYSWVVEVTAGKGRGRGEGEGCRVTFTRFRKVPGTSLGSIFLSVMYRL